MVIVVTDLRSIEIFHLFLNFFLLNIFYLKIFPLGEALFTFSRSLKFEIISAF